MLGYSLDEAQRPAEGFEFGLVDNPQVEDLWPILLPLIESGISRAGIEIFATPEQILEDILEYRTYVWVGVQDGKIEHVLLGCFKQYPATKTFEILYAVGKGLRKTFANWQRIERWAALCGATHLEVRLSPAMTRYAEKLAGKPRASYYCKPLLLSAH